MTGTPSKTQTLLARVAVALSVVLLAFGVLKYGVSGDELARLWQNTLDRPSGRFDFRFILQPLMAAFAAFRDGIADARSGRAPFLWTVVTDPAQRRGRLTEAVLATARIVLLGLAIDTAYQLYTFDSFHPAEAVLIALLLAFLPYLLLRGLVTRIWRRWVRDPRTGGIR